MLLLFASILICVAVVLALNKGIKPAWDSFDTWCKKDAVKYKKWADDIFITWSSSQSLKIARRVNLGIIFGGIVILIFTRNILLTVLLVIVAYLAPRYIYSYRKEKQMQKVEEQLPDAINIMVSSIRAGRSLPQAIENITEETDAPIKTIFKIVLYENNLGLPISEALQRAKEKLNTENFTMLVSALVIGMQQGGEVLHILEKIGISIRELTRLKKKIIIETTEVRSQEKVILCLTPIFLVLISLFDQAIRDILFSRWIGTLILIVVGILQFFAFLWIRRIIKATI